MQLQHQVCTPEQAQKLKALGVAQKSLFYYHPAFDRPVFGETKTPGSFFGEIKRGSVCNDKENAYSAFTSAELEQMLPAGFELTKIEGGELQVTDVEHYRCTFLGYQYFALHAAHNKAFMLIDLLQTGETTPAEVNASLTA